MVAVKFANFSLRKSTASETTIVLIGSVSVDFFLFRTINLIFIGCFYKMSITPFCSWWPHIFFIEIHMTTNTSLRRVWSYYVFWRFPPPYYVECISISITNPKRSPIVNIMAFMNISLNRIRTYQIDTMSGSNATKF